MAIAGPRLDRPSAIGDEGRPRTASLTVAAFVVLTVVLATATLVELTSIITAVLSGVVLFVTGMALLQRNSFRSLYGGHLCLHAGLGMFVGIGAFALVEGPRVLVFGYMLTLLGLGTTWTDTLDEETLKETASAGIGSYARMVLVFLVLFGVLIVALFVYFMLYVFTDVATPAVSIVGFLAILSGVAISVALLLRAVPLSVVRPELPERRIRRWRVASALVAGGSVLYVIVAIAVGGAGGLAQITAAVPPVGALALLLASRPVVALLAIVWTVCTVVALVSWAIPFVADRIDAGDSKGLARWSAGTSLGIVLVGALLTPLLGPPLAGIVIIGFAVFGLPLALVLILFAPGVIAGGYMARHATGAALSSAGLVAVGIGSALTGLPDPLTFGAIAGALVVWDVTTFGTGLTLELGHIPETRRLELYHAVLSVGVGVAAVVCFSLLNVVRQAIARPALLGAVLAVVGVVFLVLADRRRGR